MCPDSMRLDDPDSTSNPQHATGDRPGDRSVLDRVAAGARAEVTSGVLRIRDEISTAVRPREWVRARPLLSVLGVFGATTVLTATLAPRRSRPAAQAPKASVDRESAAPLTHGSAQAPTEGSRAVGFAARALIALGTAAAKHLIEQRVAARAEVEEVLDE